MRIGMKSCFPDGIACKRDGYKKERFRLRKRVEAHDEFYARGI